MAGLGVEGGDITSATYATRAAVNSFGCICGAVKCRQCPVRLYKVDVVSLMVLSAKYEVRVTEGGYTEALASQAV